MCLVRKTWWHRFSDGFATTYRDEINCCPACCPQPDYTIYHLWRYNITTQDLEHDAAWSDFPFCQGSAFRCRPSGERGLPGSDLRGSGSTGSARRPAHGRQAGHHADLHLHPQNRRERRDPAHLLLLSGNQSVERCGNRALGGSGRVSRPTRMLFY